MNNKKIIYITLIIIGLALIGFAAFRLISGEVEYAAARSEYDELRELFDSFNFVPTVVVPAVSEVTEQSSEPEEDSGSLVSFEPAELPDPMLALLDVNPNFVGWISIHNLISYPVVQGRDNYRYLSTTFSGRRNSSGAVFMDSRNDEELSDPVTIIYGHNMHDGSMFRPLHRLRDNAFLAEHGYIIITMPDWTVYTYKIFAVNIVSAWDVENNPRKMTAASLTRSVRGVPDDAERFLILSTCTTSADDDERLRIYAALVDVSYKE